MGVIITLFLGNIKAFYKELTAVFKEGRMKLDLVGQERGVKAVPIYYKFGPLRFC